MKNTFKKIASLLLCLCLIISGMIISASAADTTTAYYEKVTTAPTDWSGKYLIVYEGAKGPNACVFNAGLTTIDAASNNIQVTVTNGRIDYSEALANAYVTIESNGTKIKTSKGAYIGGTSGSNKLNSGSNYTNAITFTDGNAHIVSNTSVLRYNNDANNYRFRYFKSSSYAQQEPVALYKYVEVTGGDEGGDSGETPDPTPDPEEPEVTPDPEDGSTLTIAEALALGATKADGVYTTNKYYITGEITEVANTTYGNMTIKDADNNTIYIYGTKNADGTVRYDGLENKPDAGDVITVLSVVGNFGGTAQLKEAWITAHTDNNPITPDPEEPGEGGGETPDQPAGDQEAVTNTYTFSNYTAGTQYANETHALDDEVTLSTYLERCHFTTQLRIYGKTDTEVAGYAVLSSAREITAISINAGYKKTTVNIYVSSNGSDWNSTDAVVTSSTSYKDYTLNIPAGTKYVKFEATDAQIRIASMTVSLAEVKAPIADITDTSVDVGANLTVNQSITITEEDIADTTFRMDFNLNGNTTQVAPQIDGDTYTFAFDDIPAHFMADTITAKLVAIKDGQEVEQGTKTYSVAQYAKEILEGENYTTEVKNFVANMITYGAAAQKKANHNVGNLATAGLESLITQFGSNETPNEAEDKMSLSKTDSAVRFYSATVVFGDVNSLIIKLNADPGNLKLYVDDQEVALSGREYTVGNIKATQYATKYKFELKDGDTVIQTLYYGINSYAYSKSTSTDEDMQNLALALYAYGKSASALNN